MSLAVVNYPSLSKADFQWIQSIREKQDKLLFNVVDPHFTFVFPTEIIDLEILSHHIQNVSEQFEPFEFIARCVTVGDPAFLGNAHVFLIPDEGFSNIVKIHDAFYKGPLQSKLRLDLPFVPHIGIASDPSLEVCKKLVDELNAQDFEIRGRVKSFDIIEYDDRGTKTIQKIQLIKK